MDPLFLVILGATLWLVLRWLFQGTGRPALNREFVRTLFLQHLVAADRQVRVLDGARDAVRLEVEGHGCTVHLEQLHRRCGELAGQAGRLARDAAQSVLHAACEQGGLPPDWQARIVPLLLHDDSPRPDDLLTRAFMAPLTIGYALEGEGESRWLTTDDLAASGVGEDAMHALALRNLERSCSGLVIDTLVEGEDEADGVLRFNTRDGLDAARILLPSFHQRYSPRFDDADLVVAIPTRDILVFLSDQERAHVSFLAWRVRHEYSQRAYPVCDCLLHVRADGVQPWQGDDEAPGAATGVATPQPIV